MAFLYSMEAVVIFWHSLRLLSTESSDSCSGLTGVEPQEWSSAVVACPHHGVVCNEMLSAQNGCKEFLFKFL